MMEKKMTEKKFKNSILIEGDYNFNYLTNLLFIAKTCVTDVFMKKGIDAKSNKKMFKNVKHLCEFLESSIEVFSRLSLQEEEVRCIIHNIEYEDVNKPIVGFDLLDCADVDKKNNVDLTQATLSTVEDICKAFEVERIAVPFTNKLSDDIVKKNKEVDDKYNEED